MTTLGILFGLGVGAGAMEFYHRLYTPTVHETVPVVDADLEHLQSYIEDVARTVFSTDCGLNAESFHLNYDLAFSGKFNDFQHHLASRLQQDRPLRTVADVIRLYVRGMQ